MPVGRPVNASVPPSRTFSFISQLSASPLLSAAPVVLSPWPRALEQRFPRSRVSLSRPRQIHFLGSFIWPQWKLIGIPPGKNSNFNGFKPNIDCKMSLSVYCISPASCESDALHLLGAVSLVESVLFLPGAATVDTLCRRAADSEGTVGLPTLGRGRSWRLLSESSQRLSERRPRAASSTVRPRCLLQAKLNSNWVKNHL